MKPDERLAVIDLGSNSFRLVVFLAGAGWWKRTDEIYEPVRIGEGMASSGELGREPIARALATLDVFAHFANASGLDRAAIDAVATSAIRDATNGEAFLESVHIGAYAPAGQFSHKETRARKLLMHRREIDKLWGRVREKGYSIVPLKIYFKNGRAKVELGLAKGKHSYDKRDVLARRASDREIERALKGRNR